MNSANSSSNTSGQRSCMLAAMASTAVASPISRPRLAVIANSRARRASAIASVNSPELREILIDREGLCRRSDAEIGAQVPAKLLELADRSLPVAGLKRSDHYGAVCVFVRWLDSLQLTAKHRVATPVNWKQGNDVIIAGSVPNDEAREIFGEWKEPKPYLRIVPQPVE